MPRSSPGGGPGGLLGGPSNAGFPLRRLLVLALVLNACLAGVFWMTRFPHGRAAEPRARQSRVFADVLKRFDADGDGRLSREEFLRRGTALEFEHYDANHDGFLDVSEFEKAFLEEDPNPTLQGSPAAPTS